LALIVVDTYFGQKCLKHSNSAELMEGTVEQETVREYKRTQIIALAIM
jgi:hypothetical protein